MTVAEIREALDLIEELGIPVMNIRDAYPGQPTLGNPARKTAPVAGPPSLRRRQVLHIVTDTPRQG